MADEETPRASASELRRDLNALWKNTIDQFDEIKNVIVKSSSAGKAKLDSTFLKRQLEKLYQQLGETLLAHIDSGALQAPEEVKETISRIDELRAEIAAHEAEYAKITQEAVATVADVAAEAVSAISEAPKRATRDKEETKEAAQERANQRAQTVRVEVPAAAAEANDTEETVAFEAGTEDEEAAKADPPAKE